MEISLHSCQVLESPQISELVKEDKNKFLSNS